jgi:hypothetical protein
VTEYLCVVVHTDTWRDNPAHRWTTVYPFVGTLAGLVDADLENFGVLDASMCYNGSNGVGAITEVSMYDATAKGTALLRHTAPIDYVGDNWAASGGTAPQEQNREVAAVVNWPAGMSRTGKPVNFRKYFHAVPSRTSKTSGTDDIVSTDVGLIEAWAATVVVAFAPQGLAMGNARRFAGTSPTVDVFYGNHQMPRGRKRKS